MSFLDLFTGKGQAEAARDAGNARTIGRQEAEHIVSDGTRNAMGALRTGYDGSINSLMGGYGAGMDTVRQGGAQSRAALGSGFNAARSDLNMGRANALGGLSDAFTRDSAALTSGSGAARDAITGGLNNARGQFTAGIAAYDPYTGAGRSALGIAQGAMGHGGTAGVDAARAAFQTGPGFQFALDQGLDAASRAANRGGMAASGNAMQAAQTFGQGMAQQEWNNWLKSQLGLAEMGLGATNAQSALRGRMGDLEYRAGTDLGGIDLGTGQALANMGQSNAGRVATIESDYGRGMAGLSDAFGRGMANAYTREGENIGNAYARQGESISGLSSQLGRDNANLFTQLANQQSNLRIGQFDAQAGARQDEAKAYDQGSANAVNFGMQAAQTLAKMFGGMGGGSGNLFGGGGGGLSIGGGSLY